MIEFEHQKKIVDFVEANYASFLPPGLDAPTLYVDDFMDLDKFKGKVTVFFSFPDYTFTNLTNESEESKIDMSILIVVRNDTSENLKSKMLQYTTAMYKMFDESRRSFGGLVDFGNVESINFYQACEGNTSVKVAELAFKLTKEF